jgi:hypothetical protein
VCLTSNKELPSCSQIHVSWRSYRERTYHYPRTINNHDMELDNSGDVGASPSHQPSPQQRGTKMKGKKPADPLRADTCSPQVGNASIMPVKFALREMHTRTNHGTGRNQVLRDMRDSSSRKGSQTQSLGFARSLVQTLFSALSSFGSETGSEAIIPNETVGAQRLFFFAPSIMFRDESHGQLQREGVIRRWRHGAMVLSTSRPLGVHLCFLTQTLFRQESESVRVLSWTMRVCRDEP